MNERQVDVAVIGAGTAGMTAYREARKYTDKVVLIEGGSYGTTCARVGCMPSKLLIAASEAATGIQRAAGFGVHAGSIRIDGQAVMQRVRSERDRFVGFVLEGMENIDEADRIRGYARFLDAQTLEVDEHTRIRTHATVIATGSSPFIPEIFDGLGDRLLINDDVFEFEDLPESVAVFGAGVIGLELGQALHGLGVDVHIFGVRHNVGALSDPMIKEEAIRIFQADFPFQPDARIEGVSRSEKGVRVRWLDAQDQEQSQEFAYALVTAGRRPNLAGLNLEVLGVRLDRLGVPDFDKQTLQIGNAPVFLAGDANHALPLLHEAADEGRIAGRNAAHYPDVTPGLRRSPLSIVFTHPQIAMVGRRYSELELNRTAIGHVSFANQGRSRVMLENKGLMRLYADYNNGRFLGAEMFGPRVEHLAHLLAWAHQQGMSIEQMLEMPFYHPVIEEGLRTALQDTLHQLRQGPPAETGGEIEEPIDILATSGPEDPALQI